MNDVIAVKSMTDARETGLKVVTGSLEESRKSARIFTRAIYCLIVLVFVSFEVVTLVTEHRKEAIARQTIAPQQAPRSKIQLANSPRSSGTLAIPVGGRSELVLPIQGQHPDFSGIGKFLTHNVRADGSECSFGEVGCVNGPLLKGYYVTNEDTKEIIVSFQFFND